MGLLVAVSLVAALACGDDDDSDDPTGGGDAAAAFEPEPETVPEFDRSAGGVYKGVPVGS